MGNLTLRMDDKLKADAKSICADLGMDMSTAATIFFRQLVRERALPFRPTLGEPNAETYKAIEDAENGIGPHGPFNSMKELRDALDA